MLVSSTSNNVANKPLGIYIEVTKNKPVKFPTPLIKDIANTGIMSLNKADGEANQEKFYARGVLENTIFVSNLIREQEDFSLQNLELVVSSNTFPRTHDGKEVIGYEDPTYVKAQINPFELNQEALLCTQVYVLENSNKLYTNLVYIGLDKNGKPKELTPVLTPEMLISFEIAKDVDMVKEGELIKTKNGKTFLLFEYGGSLNGEPFSSHLGIGEINDGKIINCRNFYTAHDDNSDHVSTISPPLSLDENIGALFFNRSRNKQWGISYMLINMDNLEILSVCENNIIQAPQGIGPGPGGQLIAFGSHASKNGNGEIELFYHVNDTMPYYASFTVNLAI